MAAVKKIKLRAKNGGAEIEITPSAYQMRKSKYDATHTIVKEAPVVALPPINPIDPPAPDEPTVVEDAETEELDVHEESETKTEKRGPGRPKKQAE